MKSHAQVVIIGGGSLGVNLMYHLTQEGWTDIILVEKANSQVVLPGMRQVFAQTLMATTHYLAFMSTQ